MFAGSASDARIRLPIPLDELVGWCFGDACLDYRDLNEPDGWRSSSFRKIRLRGLARVIYVASEGDIPSG